MARKKHTPSPDCFKAADAAAKGALGKDEINAAFEEAGKLKDRLQAAGKMDRMGERLKQAVEAQVERTKIAAALQRKHAALNIIARDQLDQTIAAYRAAGLSPRKALLAVMEGTQQGIVGGRNSVAALRQAYEGRYIGDMMAEIERHRPHVLGLMGSKSFDDDIAREMMELREGGNPGVTGNADAQFLAKTFATYTEMSRVELNRLGAAIGKLDGWAGTQTHDDVKMIAAGKEAWTDEILPLLDRERMFPDEESIEEIRGVLGDVYDTLITGISNRVSAKEKGQRVNPANLAKMLGASRVIHFKDAESALTYRDRFGYGSTVSGIIAHQSRAAQIAAQMERFGPNPEVMLGSIVEKLKKDIKSDTTLTDVQKRDQLKGLGIDAGSLRHAFDVMSGLATRPVNVTASKLASDIRAVEAMAKLGGAVITAFPTDTVSAAAASMFRGGGFLRGLTQQIDGIMRGRPKGQQAEIAYMLGEGYDGLIGQIAHPAAANDGPVGAMSRLATTFFRWNGLTWVTDVGRSVAARVIASEMGMRASTAFDALPARYRHVLELHDIDADTWDIIRSTAWRADNGNTYVTPDRIRDVDDDAIADFAADQIEAARRAAKIDEAKTDATRAKREAKFEERRTKIIEDARREIEMAVRRFVADETTYGIVEVDPQSARFTRFGTRPGTVAGEAIRYMMQFKGFPITFVNRVLGRALFGGTGATKGERLVKNLPHLGSLMAGMAVAGYVAMTMKDFVKGYWPPRNPTDPKTVLAALQQGGALGIYGDFLFGRVNRFGGTAMETAAGPALGDIFALTDALMAAREGDVRGGEWLSIALNTTPFINLFYTRPALDYLFLNSLREAASPGYLRRQESRRRKDFGQESFLPR